MQETVQQYVSRILSYLEGQKPLDLLVSSPRKISALIKGATRRQMGKRPAPGKWSVTEILAHLADVEIVQGFRVRLILASNGVPIQGFDQDVWAGEFGYAQQDPAISLKAYLANRERNVKLMKSLTPEQWSRYGMHSERGNETVFRVAELMAGHDINHLLQIRSGLKAK